MELNLEQARVLDSVFGAADWTDADGAEFATCVNESARLGSNALVVASYLQDQIGRLNRIFTLDSCAGSGKSTVASYLVTDGRGYDAFTCACFFTPTNAATDEFQRKHEQLCEERDVPEGNVHIRCMFKEDALSIDWKKDYRLKRTGPLVSDGHLCIIDEAGVIGTELALQMLDVIWDAETDQPKRNGATILFMGDSSQLPPVKYVGSKYPMFAFLSDRLPRARQLKLRRNMRAAATDPGLQRLLAWLYDQIQLFLQEEVPKPRPLRAGALMSKIVRRLRRIGSGVDFCSRRDMPAMFEKLDDPRFIYIAYSHAKRLAAMSTALQCLDETLAPSRLFLPVARAYVPLKRKPLIFAKNGSVETSGVLGDVATHSASDMCRGATCAPWLSGENSDEEMDWSTGDEEDEDEALFRAIDGKTEASKYRPEQHLRFEVPCNGAAHTAVQMARANLRSTREGCDKCAAHFAAMTRHVHRDWIKRFLRPFHFCAEHAAVNNELFCREWTDARFLTLYKAQGQTTEHAIVDLTNVVWAIYSCGGGEYKDKEKRLRLAGETRGLDGDEAGMLASSVRPMREKLVQLAQKFNFSSLESCTQEQIVTLYMLRGVYVALSRTTDRLTIMFNGKV